MGLAEGPHLAGLLKENCKRKLAALIKFGGHVSETARVGTVPFTVRKPLFSDDFSHFPESSMDRDASPSPRSSVDSVPKSKLPRSSALQSRSAKQNEVKMATVAIVFFMKIS